MISEVLPLLLKEAEKYGVKPEISLQDGIVIRIKKDDIEKMLKESVGQYKNYVDIKSEGDIIIKIKVM
ncbi:MAG: hypothetical protein QXG57_06070 [Thermofilaceae archaeon]